MVAKVGKAGKFINCFARNVDFLPDNKFDISGDQVAVDAYLSAEFGTSGVVDARNCSALRSLKTGGSWLTDVLVSGSTQLRALVVESAGQITEVDLDGLVNLIDVDFGECALTEEAVDYVLATLDANGLSNGTVDLSEGDNSIPSASGLTSKANLEGKGWTVTVNS